MMEVLEMDLQEQLQYWRDLAEEMKRRSKIMDMQAALVQVRKTEESISFETRNQAFKIRQQKMREEAEEASKNRPAEQKETGKLISICKTPNRIFFVKVNEETAQPISYWIRVIKPEVTQTFDVFPGTQHNAFIQALDCWRLGRG